MATDQNHHETRRVGVAVLGATGTVGRQALSVIAGNEARYRVVALSAKSDVDTLFAQIQAHRPDSAVMADPAAAARLQRRVDEAGLATQITGGDEAVRSVCEDARVDTVVAGIVGAVGLLSLLAAVEAGKRVLLANKEPLVMLGAEIMRRARASGAQVLPLDSEHNAIFQCLPVTEDRHNGRASGSYSAKVSGVKRIMLTGSGGPFRERAIDTFDAITVEEAVKHPNWQMGPKISVDSATMMNKGLEVIEAIHLFAVPVDKIDVVVHPQSVIHSMVEFIDGSVIAELATPDMRVPIAHALAWPQRIPSGAESLDFTQLGALTFDKPNENRFPCLRLAKEAVDRGGTATTVLNAANEVAVDAFLARQIRFTDIVHIIESSLSRAKIADSLSLDQVLQADVAARQIARECIAVSTAPSRKSLSSATPTPSRVYE